MIAANTKTKRTKRETKQLPDDTKQPRVNAKRLGRGGHRVARASNADEASIRALRHVSSSVVVTEVTRQIVRTIHRVHEAHLSITRDEAHGLEDDAA